MSSKKNPHGLCRYYSLKLTLSFTALSILFSSSSLSLWLMMNGGKNRFPFTPSQWQELEHQALIFKYMASGIPIPPDLVFSIKRASLNSPLSSRLLSLPPQHFGWNYLEMGLGRKIDTEPGRCRRTDGKKWRCSKEAYPNSKYCERHMHRGNNRLRKPLQQQQQGFRTTLTSPTNHTNSSTVTKSNIPPPSLSLTTHSSSLTPLSDATHNHSFLYNHQHPSRSSSSSAFGFSLQDDCASHLNSGYVYDGLKEEVDEHAFFKEPSGTMRSFSASSMEDSSWHLAPLSMSSSSSSSKQRSYSGLSTEYSSYLQLQNQNLGECTNQQDQDYYMLGLRKSEEPQNQKTVHRFFDESPNKSKNSWLDCDDKSSTTQLSISIPTSSDDHDHFPSFNFRTRQDV
ncbi:growth-regulating factor 1-like isoform X2 [Prosopis cineraria]|uniref:growth-regulating factor 1-like isoform X2 n=1 Tax=Prosopis cineraria TaxID=364024 RepID=UPI00240F147C|nr:growth-regulating factor 1-like isoform X2 [Prosopis cineraria]